MTAARLAETAADLERQLLEAYDTKDRLEAQAGEHAQMAEALAEARDVAAESERRYRTLAESSPIGIWQVTLQGETRYANPALCAMLGLSRDDDLTGSRYERFVLPESLEPLAVARATWADGVAFDCEVRILGMGGETRDVELCGAPLLSGAGEVRSILMTVVDITDRKRAEETIWKVAHHDPLTGLPNRQLFHDRLESAVQYADRLDRSIALLFVDLDFFKEVNDSFGHPVGDALLQEVARELCEAVRETDTVARLGGDEFAIVLTNLEEVETVHQVATRIVEQIARPHVIENSLLNIGASIGVSFYPQDDADPDELIRKADLALYQAKRDGRGCYHLYDEAMHSKVKTQVAMENDMRLALVRKEFELHFQPQVSTEGHRLIGAEALVRWRNPRRGLISPGEFIPIAEASGLVIPLGEWVLRTACVQNKAWQDAGLPCFRVTVNISAKQFQSDDLIDRVESALEESGLDPCWLELEITESMVIEDVDQVIEKLARLRALGVETAIDDFGTGYSSLAYLKRFPVNRLKIDQSFVRNLTSDRDDEAIVEAIILLGHSLDLQVIAEGVETKEQLAMLSRKGCDEIQGYYFARPLPTAEFAEWAALHAGMSASDAVAV